ncbi:hypothetical protein BDN72DRAFT_954730 [Pluteus cervinus]|uniref:Uncharacterized protein n=1 Tax=Pluteus cervinus TaxID=181527 RepID=A0ACD3BD10_9AGAR|nr:hypothetical protein BDN72DRAFT_954730 [Pluteus cervinus]
MSAPTFPETYGAMFIGLLFATFLQGVLTVQLYHYFCNFPRDNVWTKLLVSVVWCLDLTHLIFIAYTTYHYLVTNWGNPAALAWSTIPLNLHLIFISLSSLFCQVYFLHRAWLLTARNIPLTAFIATICLSVLAVNVRITKRLLGNLSVAAFSDEPGVTLAGFVLGAISDVAIASVLCLHLGKGKGQFKKTNNIISKLISTTVATGAATSVLGVACTIAYLIAPHTLVFIAMHFSLGRMYTNALLVTLNARKTLRATVDGFVLSGETSRIPHTPYTPGAYSNFAEPQMYTSMVKNDGSLVLDEVQLATSPHKTGVLVTKVQATHTDPHDIEDGDRKH